MVHIVNMTWPNPAGLKWERGKFSNERPLVKARNESACGLFWF